MNPGKVKYAEYQGVQVLRFIGNICYTQGPALERFLGRLCMGEPPRGFVIDLSRTDSLDSTSLGLLARVAKWLQREGAPQATLVSSNEDVNDLLYSVGFHEVFTITTSGPGTGTAEVVNLLLEGAGETELSATVLEAHRVLMSLNQRNRVEFQDVVRLLEKQVHGAVADGL